MKAINLYEFNSSKAPNEWKEISEEDYLKEKIICEHCGKTIINLLCKKCEIELTLSI